MSVALDGQGALQVTWGDFRSTRDFCIFLEYFHRFWCSLLPLIFILFLLTCSLISLLEMDHVVKSRFDDWLLLYNKTYQIISPTSLAPPFFIWDVLGLSECLSPSLFLPLPSTHLFVLVLIIVTLYTDYSPLVSLLDFPDSLTFPLLWHNNFIGFPSPPALNLKFFSSFLIKSQHGSAPKYLCDHIRPPISASSLRRHRSSQRHDLFMLRVSTTIAHT